MQDENIKVHFVNNPSQQMESGEIPPTQKTEENVVMKEISEEQKVEPITDPTT